MLCNSKRAVGKTLIEFSIFENRKRKRKKKCLKRKKNITANEMKCHSVWTENEKREFHLKRFKTVINAHCKLNNDNTYKKRKK